MLVASQFRPVHTKNGYQIKPIDIRLLREAGAARRFIAGVVAFGLLGTAASVAFAYCLSLIVARIFIGHQSLGSVSPYFFWLLLAVVVRSSVIWLQEVMGARAAAKVKVELRSKANQALERLGPSWMANRSLAEVNHLLTVGLDSLDSYFSKYLPQLVYTVLVTPCLVAIIFFQDSLSAITICATLPLVPLFMVLIGWATKTVQTEQLDSQVRLSQHFLEILRGLTTLKIFGRIDAQRNILEGVSERYRVKTMKVLRLSFLSGFALELISSLSVALIAVSIGLRLLSGNLQLEVGLFVLILAPEAYLPIRQVGAHFHAAADGATAAQRSLDIIDEAIDLEAAAFVGEPDFEFGSITVITGPSGVGKSTIFKRLMGFADGSETANRSQIAWMPQGANLLNGTVLENIVGPGMKVDRLALERCLDFAALDGLGLDVQVGVDGAMISGGQAQRVSLARAFYRAMTCNSQYLLLDEPVSSLDEERILKVISSLRMMAEQGLAVAVISHEPMLIEAADRRLEVKHA